MTRKPATVAFWRGRLPHWEVEEGRYFVTIHLAGAIPEEGRQRVLTINEQSKQFPSNSDKWLRIQRMVFREMEHWLHRVTHVTHLGQQPIAEMVIEAIEHRQARGDWRMFEYVVMPNHIHMFFELLRPGLKQVLEDFKRWTGNRACRVLDLDGDRFWQCEWFDHWSRSDEEDEKIIRYIQQNPVIAGLVAEYLGWPYGSWRR